MQETPVIVVIEVVSVEDAKGLKVYQERASELIGPLGGVMLGRGGRRFPRLAGQRSLPTSSSNSACKRHNEGGNCSDQRRSVRARQLAVNDATCLKNASAGWPGEP
jgi:hypothetical protein